MEANKDGGSAFPNPVYVELEGSETRCDKGNIQCVGGMTLRQYYKAAAMQAMDLKEGKENSRGQLDGGDTKWVADACGAYADALLAEDEEHARKS